MWKEKGHCRVFDTECHSRREKFNPKKLCLPPGAVRIQRDFLLRNIQT
jgi:hypothetical protein